MEKSLHRKFGFYFYILINIINQGVRKVYKKIPGTRIFWVYMKIAGIV